LLVIAVFPGEKDGLSCFIGATLRDLAAGTMARALWHISWRNDRKGGFSVLDAVVASKS